MSHIPLLLWYVKPCLLILSSVLWLKIETRDRLSNTLSLSLSAYFFHPFPTTNLFYLFNHFTLCYPVYLSTYSLMSHSVPILFLPLTLSTLLQVISLSHELAATPNQTKPHLTMAQGLKNYNWARLPRPSTLYTPLFPPSSLHLPPSYSLSVVRPVWPSHVAAVAYANIFTLRIRHVVHKEITNRKKKESIS